MLKRSMRTGMLLTTALLACVWAMPALAADTSKPVKVFILAGQSNMQGHGRIDMGKDGDLNTAAKEFPHLKDGSKWAERDDVWYYHQPGKGELQTSNLKPGLGGRPDSIGPELQFGHLMGDYYDEQVLLIKTAWGGQALGRPFLPPSSAMPDEEQLQKDLQDTKRRNPQATMEEIKSSYGSKYRQMLKEVRNALDNLEKHFPDYKGQGYEIAGFFWHQGWNDGTNREFAQTYEANMINFIKDVRKDLDNENLPFVIATSGMGGPDATGVAGFLGKSIEPAQKKAAEQYDNCTAVETRHFQRHKPGRQKSHWHNSAESYVLVGNAAGKAMIEILEKQEPSKQEAGTP